MANLNKTQTIGNLTRDPEIRYTPKGTAVGDLAIATNRRVKVPNSEEWTDEVTFIDITVWGKTAENCQKYLKKGAPVFVEGRLQLDSWDDKETGAKRSKLKVIGENVQFLGSKPAGGSAPGHDPRRETPKNHSIPSNRQEDPHPDDPEDDIPF